MKENSSIKNPLNKPRVIFLAACAGLAFAITAWVPGPLHQTVRDLFMSHVASAHYRVLFNRNDLSPEAAQNFANQRESLFAALHRKLGSGIASEPITVVFDSAMHAADPLGLQRGYAVNRSVIRANPADIARANPSVNPSMTGPLTPRLDPAADAEAILRSAWGPPGSAEMGYWTALWLVGQHRGEELGMAAAEVERRVGYKTVTALLEAKSSQPAKPAQPNGSLTPQDRALLAAAWLNEVAQFSGTEQVHKLYSARVSKLDVVTATAALGTTRPELERKWQLWLYSYLAGMPAAGSQTMSMPMHMNMAAPASQ